MPHPVKRRLNATMFFKLLSALAIAALGIWPRAALAQIDSGQVVPDLATSAPVLTYTDACRGRFGVDYGRRQACFFEKPHFQGRCVCVGPRPTRSVPGAFRLESSEVGSIRIAPQLAVNIVLDEYKHEIKSFRRGSSRPKPVNYIVVARADSVCAFHESNYLGRKHCLSAARHMDHRFHFAPFEFQSLMVVPERKARVKAEIRRRHFVTRSAALPMEIENGGAPASDGSEPFNFSQMDDQARAHMPYRKLRLAWRD